MAYKSRKHRSYGGKTEGKAEHQYNAQGSPEEKAENAKSEGFKRGGSHHKRAHGGHVEGEHAKHHMGHMKRARGGSVRHKGGSPFSSGHSKSGAEGKGNGSPGEQAPVEP